MKFEVSVCIASKMKHSRAEIIKSTVCSYLKRRQYTDSEVFLKSDLQLCQTKQQWAVLSAVNNETANKNSIALSSFIFDFNVLDQHFSRLNSWVSRLSGSVQKEIFAFLPPLLCHLTMDLMNWNVMLDSNPLTVSPAINFLKKHASALSIQDNSPVDRNVYGFGNTETHNEFDQEFRQSEWRLLEELYSIENCWDICKSKSLLLFRSCKYRLDLTSEALALLQQYLADHAHICIIQAFKAWFDVVEISDNTTLSEEEPEDEEDEIIVQLWEEGIDDNYDSEKTSYIKQEQSAVNGCKEESAPLLSSKGRESLEESSSECEGSSNKEMSNEKSEDEEKQLKLLEGAIRSVREGPSPVKPLLVYSVENADDNIVCTYVSHNGDMLAAGLGTSEVKIWGLTEGGLPAEVREVVASNYVHNKDRKQFARLACDIDVFDGEAYGNMVEEEEDEWTDTPIILRGHCGPVQDVSISGDILYSCSTDTTLRAWNINENTCAAIYRGHFHPIWCLDVSTWGLYMATGSQDRTARLWSPERAFPLRIYAGHGLDVDCIRFHPNGLYLATGSSDHSVRLWSVSEGKLVRVFPHTYRGRVVNYTERSGRPNINYSPSVTSLAFSPDGKFLASGAEDQKIRIWDLAAGSVVNELNTQSVSWSSEYQNVSAATGDDTSNSDGAGALGIHGSVSALCWSSSGDRLASAFKDGTVAIWELNGGKCVGEYASSPFTSQTTGNSLFEDGQRTNSDGTSAQSLAVNTYSTGISPLSSLQHIEGEVLVCVGSSNSKYGV